jgi:hypothetical protein
MPTTKRKQPPKKHVLVRFIPREGQISLPGSVCMTVRGATAKQLQRKFLKALSNGK